jgi:prepilin-type N-terminal cleavage/methylation domain-containing protein
LINKKIFLEKGQIMKLSKSRKGLTLIELLIVVIILAALAAIAIPRMSQNTATARQRACYTNIATMNTQIELYNSEEEEYPDGLTDVTQNTDYFPDGEPNCPSGGTYSMDPNTYRVSCNTHGTP